MPIRVLTKELVRDIIESYGQVTKLNLSTNDISFVENLEQLTCLTKLDLFCNRLGPDPGCLDGLAPLTRLRELDISDNSITTLRPLSLASITLERLDVSNNDVALVDEIMHLIPLSALTDLVLTGNPLSEEKGYRLRTLTVLPSLKALDHIPRQHRGFTEAGKKGGSNQRMERLDFGEQVTDSSEASLNDVEPGGTRMQVSDGSGAETVTSESRSSHVGGVNTQACFQSGIGDEYQKKGEERLRERSEERLVISLQRGSVGDSSTAVQSEDLEPKIASGDGAHILEATKRSAISLPAGLSVRGSSHSVSAISFGDVPRVVDSDELELAATGPDTDAIARLGSRALSMASAGSFQEISFEGKIQPAAGHRLNDNHSGDQVAERELTTTTSLECLNEVSIKGGQGKARVSFVDRAPIPSPWHECGSASFPRRMVDNAYSTDGDPKITGGEGDAAMWWTGSWPGGHGSQSSTTAPNNASDDNLLQPFFSSLGLLERNKGTSAASGNGSRVPLVREEKQGGDALLSSRQEDHSFRDSAFVVPITSAMTLGNGRDDLRRSVGDPPYWMRPSDADVGRSPESKEDPHVRAATASTSMGHGLFDVAPPPKKGWLHTGLDDVPREGWSRGGDVEHGTARGSAAVVVEGVVEGNWRSSISAARAGIDTRRGVGDRVVENTVVINRGELEELRRENEDLRRQAALAEKRCTALSQMQRLADEALSKAQTSLSSPVPDQTIASKKFGNPFTNRDVGVGAIEAKQMGRSLGKSQKRSKERSLESEEVNDDFAGTPVESAVSTLLVCWRREVLKLLLEKGVMVQASEENCRQADRKVLEAREAQSRAENEVKSLTQRAVAAEAEAELLGIKLRKALEELRSDRAQRRASQALSSGYILAIRGLQQWMQGFIERASEGFFEREAMLARGIAKLEEFSKRLDMSAGRLKLLGTLMKHKEVQLRNSRAALVADRRVWLLERRDKEMEAALGSAQASHPVAPDIKMSRGPKEVWCGREERMRNWAPSKTELLEGLRPECEAVMRALFCRVDRLGTGAVRARRLLSVLRSDCGVTELMEAAVGASRWAAALDSMEEALCSSDHPPIVSGNSGEISGERNVTWGEFLLFFLPKVGPADDAYNAGLVSSRSGDIERYPPVSLTREIAVERRGDRDRCGEIGVVSEDSLAMLQMVVPRGWTARDSAEGGRSRRQRQGGFGSLSVGQLRREALRLAKERAFLMAMVREEGRLGGKRAEAVHDQYRHELRALHARVRELETSLGEVESGADGQRERADALELEISRLRGELQEAEKAWKSRLDAVGKDKIAALEKVSTKATKSETEARERFSRLEAEHALALKENGKASIRQRALERELSRMKTSLEVEARLEKEALEERLREGESKLAIARRERNALLAALRDLQRQGNCEPCPRPSSASFDLETSGDGKAEPCCDDQRASATAENAHELGRPVGAVHGLSEASESRERGGLGSEARGEGTGRAASLTARLEVLAIQTRQLLEEGSDSSCSGDDFKLD